jgi:hypothetical protein
MHGQSGLHNQDSGSHYSSCQSDHNGCESPQSLGYHHSVIKQSRHLVSLQSPLQTCMHQSDSTTMMQQWAETGSHAMQ